MSMDKICRYSGQVNTIIPNHKFTESLAPDLYLLRPALSVEKLFCLGLCPGPRGTLDGRMDISLYIHYPFCRSKCGYCAFNSTAGSTISPADYSKGLLEEMALRAATITGPLRAITLYLGGGTPSLLDPDQVVRLTGAARELFGLTSAAEVTLEANPGTVTRSSLDRFRSAGVNRLSLGVQSFTDRFLAILGRSHSAAQVHQAFTAARQAGFTNVSLDLMHSLPGQTLAQWAGELEQACALAPEHLSVYGLTVEPGTPFARLEDAGQLDLPDDELSARMYETAAEYLQGQGYEQYEIANFARPGFRSRHNCGYWQRRTCLAFGAGAHSFLSWPGHGRRLSNLEQPGEYLQALADRQLPEADRYELGRTDAMAERMFLGLRLVEGVQLADFREEFGISFAEAYGPVCADLFQAGLLEIVEGFLRLPGRARVLSNQVFQRFV